MPTNKSSMSKWLKNIKRICYEHMEGCDEPEWSLFSNIYSIICLYEHGDSGYSICNPFNHDNCPIINSMNKMYMEETVDYKYVDNMNAIDLKAQGIM